MKCRRNVNTDEKHSLSKTEISLTWVEFVDIDDMFVVQVFVA